jgi:integrase
VDPEVLGDLLDAHTGLPVAGHPHDVVTELARVGLRHGNILPGPPTGKPAQVSPIRAADPMQRMRAPSAPNVRNVADDAVVHSPRERALSARDVRRLMEYAETLGPQALVRWHLGLYVGLRQAECLGMVWENVNIGRAEIKIDRQLYRQAWQHGCKDEECGRLAQSCPARHGGGLRVIRTTKTNQIRTVPITDDIAQGLANLYDEQQEEREAAGDKWQEERDWRGLVFRRPWGAPISPSDDWRQWQEMTQTVLGRRARVHDARHSAATLMIDAGAPLTAVRDVLGHSCRRRLKTDP